MNVLMLTDDLGDTIIVEKSKIKYIRTYEEAEDSYVISFKIDSEEVTLIYETEESFKRAVQFIKSKLERCYEEKHNQ